MSQALSALRRRRGVGLEVRPGAVRTARQEAGLSLAAVAGVELTRAAIHRVETGLAKPSLTTLQLIASRTGQPLSYFLAEGAKSDLDPAVELERLVGRGEFPEVLAQAAKVLSNPGTRSDVRARVLYWKSEAHVRRIEPELALECLDEALEAFRSEPDPWMTALTLHMKSCALFLLDDPQAVFVGESALRACQELDPAWPILNARILNHLASLSLGRQETTHAIRYYEAAVKAAEPLRNLRQLSLMYEGLGIAYKRLGRTAVSRDYFTRALSLYSLQSDMASMAHAEINLAELLTKQGNLDAAAEKIDSALSWCSEAEVDRRNRSFALAGLGSLQLARGDLEVAERTLYAAIDMASERGEPSSHSAALLSLGRLHTQTDHHDQADQAYRQAIDILDRLNAPERLRDAHIEYAGSLDRQGRADEAKAEWMAAALVGRREDQAEVRSHTA